MRRALILLVCTAAFIVVTTVPGSACDARFCQGSGPVVGAEAGNLTAAYFDQRDGHGYASNTTVGVQLRQWRLMAQCDVTDAAVGGCGRQMTCDESPDRLLAYYIVQSRRLVPPDHSPVDGRSAPLELTPGSPFGAWVSVYAGCVDVTDLNPAPTPDEVYRYFKTIPLPQLVTQQQPPGNALVGLPVIFFTTGPTTQTHTLDIRGFQVAITATATRFNWHTGDGTDLTSTTPGAPYPHQTITHQYRSGSYTASLTATWSGTFTVNGGPATPVPGTTTDGPPVTFAVLQAHTALTNPYD